MMMLVDYQEAPKCFYKCWGAVLCALLLVSTVKSESMTMQDMESILNSHNQTLNNVKRYQTKVDDFYDWYRANHWRLDNLVRGDEAMKNLTSRVVNLENLNQTQARSLDQQRKQLSALKNQLEQVTVQLREKDAQIEELLEAAAVSNNTLSDLAAKSDRSIEELVMNLTRVADQVDQRDSEIKRLVSTSLEAKIPNLETRIQTLEDSRKLNSDQTLYLNETINSMQSELQDVINKPEQYDALRGSLSYLSSKVDQLEKKQREDSVAVDVMEGSLRGNLGRITSEIQRKSTRTAGDISKLRHSISEVTRSVQQATSDHNSVSYKVNNLEDSSQNATVEIGSLQDKLQQLGTEMDRQATTIESLRTKVVSLDSLAAGLENSRTDATSDVNTLTEKVGDLTAQIESAGVSAITSTIQNINNKLQELEMKVNE